jgi:hypothetical protein
MIGVDGFSGFMTLRALQRSAYISVCLLMCDLACAQTTDAKLDAVKLAQQSTFVFNGTVVAASSTTVSQIPTSASTVVVTVDSVQRCTTNVCGAKKVTVRLLVPGSLKENEKATFFTAGQFLGSGIVVTELQHVTPPFDATAILASGSKALSDQALREQLAAARCVISGHVDSVQPLIGTAQRSGEHADPKLQDAKIKVLTVEKNGCLPAGTAFVDVVFPTSLDAAWVTAPRFHEGQDGIWILTTYAEGRFKAFAAAPSPRTYTASGSNDFRSLNDIAAIRSALSQNGAKKPQ